MKSTSKLVAILGAAAICAAAPAYDWDTHYCLTFGIARSVGFTTEQSYRIASACQGMDEDEHTEPLHKTVFGIAHDAVSLKYETQRVNFHAMLDERGSSPQWLSGETRALAEAVAAIKVRGNSLQANSIRQGNLGAWLHFAQDSYTHAGYGSRYGHGDYVGKHRLILGDDLKYSDLLRVGHDTDYIDYLPSPFVKKVLQKMGFPTYSDRNIAMAEATFEALASYLAVENPQQLKHTTRNKSLAMSLLEKLQKANPGRVPERTLALQAVRSFPGLDIPDDYRPIDYITDGNSEWQAVADPGEFQLWGDLTVMVPRTNARQSVACTQVTLAVDTGFASQPAYVLYEQKGISGGRGKGDGAEDQVTFFKVPVGDLVITAKFSDGSTRTLNYDFRRPGAVAYLGHFGTVGLSGSQSGGFKLNLGSPLGIMGWFRRYYPLIARSQNPSRTNEDLAKVQALLSSTVTIGGRKFTTVSDLNSTVTVLLGNSIADIPKGRIVLTTPDGEYYMGDLLRFEIEVDARFTFPTKDQLEAERIAKMSVAEKALNGLGPDGRPIKPRPRSHYMENSSLAVEATKRYSCLLATVPGAQWPFHRVPLQDENSVSITNQMLRNLRNQGTSISDAERKDTNEALDSIREAKTDEAGFLFEETESDVRVSGTVNGRWPDGSFDITAGDGRGALGEGRHLNQENIEPRRSARPDGTRPTPVIRHGSASGSAPVPPVDQVRIPAGKPTQPQRSGKSIGVVAFNKKLDLPATDFWISWDEANAFRVSRRVREIGQGITPTTRVLDLGFKFDSRISIPLRELQEDQEKLEWRIGSLGDLSRETDVHITWRIRPRP